MLNLIDRRTNDDSSRKQPPNETPMLGGSARPPIESLPDSRRSISSNGAQVPAARTLSVCVSVSFRSTRRPVRPRGRAMQAA